MKILLLGKNGQVGWELNRSLQPLGEVIALGREKANFLDLESLRQIVRHVSPDVIVNAVAYTAVDKAEEQVDLAENINSIAPSVLAEEALMIGALLVHYSTDYVFDGSKDGPYSETDQPKPINAYGRSKLAGELAIQSSGCDYLIFRTSWVYTSRGHNFLLTMLKLAQERDELCIVADQIGSPTSARMIADMTLLCLQQALKERHAGVFSSDLYHMTAIGHTSWYGFTKEIIRIVSVSQKSHVTVKSIKKIPASDYPTPAARPMNSQLDNTKLKRAFSVELPDWKNVLQLCIEDLLLDDITN